MGDTGTRQFAGSLDSLNYDMTKCDNPILAPDSLWPVWAENAMYKNVDILTLTPDSLLAIQADNMGYIQWVIRE